MLVEVFVEDVLAHFARVDRMPEPVHLFLVQFHVVHVQVAHHRLVGVLERRRVTATDRVIVGVPGASTRRR